MAADTENDKQRIRRAKSFDRHKKAAAAGIHLPTLSELYLLCPFYGGKFRSDVQAFAERMATTIKGESAVAQDLRSCLTSVTVNPDVDTCVAASLAFLNFVSEEPRKRDIWHEASNRFSFYAACLGDRDSMWKVSGSLARFAAHDNTPSEHSFDYLLHGIGWTLAASDLHPSSLFFRRNDPRDELYERGAQLFDRSRQALDSRVSAEKDAVVEKGDIQISQGDEPQDDQDVGEKSAVVVLRRLHNAEGREAKNIEREFREITGKPLPLVRMPDLDVIHNALIVEFPHAFPVVQAMLSDLSRKRFVAMRPTILVGSPGSGKTTFAERVLDLLNVPNESCPCGGATDSSISGTSRKWYTGESSLPLAMVRRHVTASPGLILDELEKASQSRVNGSIYDALLPFFEPQSARQCVDPYLQAPVDLSHVIWLATANSLKGIPGPLLDRCRIIRFPEPGRSDMPVLATHMMRSMLERQGMKPAWMEPFSPVEMSAIGNVWKDSSLRSLQRIVEAVLVARDRTRSRH